MNEDIKWGNIRDRIPVITSARRVVRKHLHLKMVEEKWNFARKQADNFAAMIKPLVQRGLHLFWEEKGPMLSQKEYYDILVECRKDHRKFEDMAQQSLSNTTVIKKIVWGISIIIWFQSFVHKVTNASLFGEPRNQSISRRDGKAEDTDR